MHHKARYKAALAAVFLLVAASGNVAATWTTLDIGTTSDQWFTSAFGNLPDGRLIYGEHGNIFLQDSWGSSSFSSYSSAPSGTDPAFIAVYDNSTALLGSGGWGTSGVYKFAPDSVASLFPSFANIQNYDAAFKDADGFYLSGTSTGTGNDRHGVRYMSVDGAVNKVVIDDISQYSSGMALDSGGNLYVADNDDDKVFRFTGAQLENAILGTALSIADGELIYDFEMGMTGSLAIDSDGVLWAAGWGSNGFVSYDPVLDKLTSYTPGADNSNYRVGTFSDGAKSYVAFLNADGTSVGSNLLYGYADASLVPEPGTALLALCGLIAFALRRLASTMRLLF